MHREVIQITFPDGAQKDFPRGVTGLDIAQQIDVVPVENVLAMEVDGEVWDATLAIDKNVTVRLLTWEDEAGKRVFWHSSAHLLAEALEALYPGIQLGAGPSTEHGFYYDVDFGTQHFDAAHLEKIEHKMLELARLKRAYQRIAVSKEQAIRHFEQRGGRYKLALLEGLEDGQITFYKQGDFVDLCRGPHIPHTGFIKAVKLLNVAGAYWRGDEKNEQLTRIYGIAFPQKKALKAYLVALEEAKKRNHQKLGKQLGLFTFSEEVGLGLPLWLPKGALLRETLKQFLHKEQLKAGYQPVVTPHIGHKRLYVTSGHYEKYGQDAFQPIHTPHAEHTFLLKPMNCPHHCEIYRHTPRSYRALPLRLAEFGTVYRYEQHGELHGLARTRCFTQDDAHIFCRPDQVQEEFVKIIDLVCYVLEKLGLPTYTAQISLRDPKQPERYMGGEHDWIQAERAIQEAASQKGLQTTRVLGEAAFYGPKLDFMVRDALGRKWQLGTVQLDYQLPERFGLNYIGPDNQKHRPVLIHRAPFGSLERFIALLIEHTGGKFPFWLAPDQVVVLPISNSYAAYADQVCQQLIAHNIRAFVDHCDEKIGKKIKHAELHKVPYMLIVGEKEALERTVAVREQGGGHQYNQSVDVFLEVVMKERL